ncbi:Rrf2 family transcriptional regulator [bacterium]|nr:Rrf2 family transcriptional regulator [bacterium]
MLSTTSEHAIRALVFLAKIPQGESVLGRDLSSIAEVPSNYLAKILVQLNRQGMLEATRGRGGGYRLSRPAEDIRLIEVVTALEGEAAIPQCILEHSRICSDENPCAAHPDWKHVRNTYIRFLNDTTIARIASNLEEDDVEKLLARLKTLESVEPKHQA